MANILIVGGGVAGLSAGIYAQLAGHHATIYEKHTVAGGNLTGWQRGDYHIDNCIHWLTGTNPNTSTFKMWCELGVLGNVEIMQGDSLYTCECDGKQISLYNDLEKIKTEMLEISPIDQVETLKFINTIKLLQYLSGIGGETHSKKCGVLYFLKNVPTLLKYHKLSAGQLAKRFSHPLLKHFISCFVGDDFAALAIMLVFAYFTAENGGIPKGSSYAMAQRMINKFSSLGGKLMTGVTVTKINTEGTLAKYADLSNGQTVDFDYAILTVDPTTAFEKILDYPMPRQLERFYKDKRLLRFSSYHCAFSCDTDNPGFKGDFIIEIPTILREKLHSKYLILREFSHESDFAPPGKSIIQSLIFCNEQDCQGFIRLKQNSLAYDALKKELSKLIQELITERFPNLTGKLKCIDVWTPATYKRYIGSEIGSYMGFALPPRFVPTHASHKIKGLDNVVLATQWQQAPGGLPIAASEGKGAISTINKAINARKRTVSMSN